MKKTVLLLAAIGLAATSVPAAAQPKADHVVSDPSPDPAYYPLWWSFVDWFSNKRLQISDIRGF